MPSPERGDDQGAVELGGISACDSAIISNSGRSTATDQHRRATHHAPDQPIALVFPSHQQRMRIPTQIPSNLLHILRRYKNLGFYVSPFRVVS